MLKVFLYILFSPIYFFIKIAEFIVWDFLSDWYWKEKEKSGWTDRLGSAIEAERRSRDLELRYRYKLAELESKNRKLENARSVR